MRDFFLKRRQELIDKVYQPFTVGLELEPLEFERGMQSTILAVTESAHVPLKLEGNSDFPMSFEIEIAKDDAKYGALFVALREYVNRMVESGWSRYKSIAPNSVLKIAAASLRGRQGCSIDFYQDGASWVVRYPARMSLKRRAGETGVIIISASNAGKRLTHTADFQMLQIYRPSQTFVVRSAAALTSWFLRETFRRLSDTSCISAGRVRTACTAQEASGAARKSCNGVARVGPIPRVVVNLKMMPI